MWTWAPEENAGAATRTVTKLWDDPEYNNLKQWISVGEGVPLPRPRIQVVHGWRTTLSPAADFINARPRGDTQLMWLRLRSTSLVPTMLTTHSAPAALA
jgi:hypothetical protein